MHIALIMVCNYYALIIGFIIQVYWMESAEKCTQQKNMQTSQRLPWRRV